MVHFLPPPDSYSILLSESNSTEVNGELIARTETARDQGREDLAQVNPEKKKKKERKEEEKSNCGQSLDTRVHNDISLFRDICEYIQRENATEQRGVVKG